MSSGQKLKSYLEVITTLAVLLAAAAVVSTYFFSPTGQQKTRLQPGLQKENTLGPVQGVNYGDSPQTLLIAMDTRCGYCAAGVPFYNQLAELQRDGGKGTPVIAVFPNSADEVR